MKSNNIKDYAKRLWQNFVVRNVVLFVSLLILFILIISVLLNLFTRHNTYRDVPDFSGYTMDEARTLAKKDKLRLEINDSLYVPLMDPVILDQRPGAGTQVKSGRRIFVTVNSFRQKMVNVPYVAGYSLRQAKNMLETAGLGIEKLVYVDTIGTNYVVKQYVGDREVTRREPAQAEYGSDVVLAVGREPNAEPVTVPRVVGFTLRDAESRLLEAGLNIGRPVNDNDINPRNQRSARVYKQSPAQSEYAALGSAVTLYLSLDSLTVVKGVDASDAAAQKLARERFITDSLSREGYSGEMLRSEAQWFMKLERGELSPEDIAERVRRLTEEVAPDALPDGDHYNDEYIGEEIPVDDLDDAEQPGGTGGTEEDFFF